MSRSIGQAFSDDAFQGAFRAPFIVDAQRTAGIIPEIELGKIAVKMFFLAMLINALHAPFENTEIALGGIGVNVASDVFARRMVDALVSGNVPIRARVQPAFVGMQNGAARKIAAKYKITQQTVSDIKLGRRWGWL